MLQTSHCFESVSLCQQPNIWLDKHVTHSKWKIISINYVHCECPSIECWKFPGSQCRPNELGLSLIKGIHHFQLLMIIRLSRHSTSTMMQIMDIIQYPNEYLKLPLMLLLLSLCNFILCKCGFCCCCCCRLVVWTNIVCSFDSASICRQRRKSLVSMASMRCIIANIC